MIHTQVVFLVVCGNFALSGYILFGEQVLEWPLAIDRGSHLEF